MQDIHPVLNEARQLQEETIALRRQLHAHPELSFKEYNTAKLLAAKLSSMGYTVKTGVGKTGLIADLGAGATVAIRAEMDAVPIGELNRTTYSSTVAGVSHACGHDANIACAIAAAKMLSELKPPGRIRMIMQPAAEESCDENGKTGTQRMIEEGALEDVQAIITLHVDGTLATGKVGILLEPQAVSTNIFKIVLCSREGINKQGQAQDTVLLAARLVQDIYEKAGQSSVSSDGNVLFVSSIQSSSMHADVPANQVTVQGFFRSMSKDARKSIMSKLDQICASIAKESCECTILYGVPQSAHGNSPEIAELMRQIASELIGIDNVLVLKRKTWTEDFASFTEVVPGALVLLGAEIAGNRRIAHSPTFDVDESCLCVGAAILAETACQLIDKIQTMK